MPTPSAGDIKFSLTREPVGDSYFFPVLEAYPSMGNGSYLPETDTIIGSMRVSRDWAQANLRNASSMQNLAILTARGPSMEPTFGDGDILIVDRGITEIKIDDVYVLRKNDELFVKRVQRWENNSLLMLSDNPKYKPRVIGEGERDDFAVLGRVIWAWSGRQP